MLSLEVLEELLFHDFFSILVVLGKLSCSLTWCIHQSLPSLSHGVLFSYCLCLFFIRIPVFWIRAHSDPLQTNFTLIWSTTTLFPKKSHIHKYQWLGLKHIFYGDTVQPATEKAKAVFIYVHLPWWNNIRDFTVFLLFLEENADN